MALDKPLHLLTEADLQELITSAVAEGRTIEYKSALPGNSDYDKREFVSDVSSFANTSGGQIVYGIEEDAGIPIAIRPLRVTDIDAEKLRLENLLKDCVAPRMFGVEIQPVPATPGLTLVIRLPKSLNAPHMMTFRGSSKFFARNSAGKYQLDVEQLRSAFAFSRATRERLRDFRVERISKLLAGSGPETMQFKALVTLHLMPLSAFESEVRLEAHSLEEIANRLRLQPICTTSAFHGYYNFDGYLRSYKASEAPQSPAFSYIQLFRDGIIETVDSVLLSRRNAIPSFAFEQRLLQGLPHYFHALGELGLNPPIFVGLSLSGIKGFMMGLPESAWDIVGPTACDRDNLMLPEEVAESITPDFDKLMKPIFDSVWNAMGMSESIHYRGSKWVGLAR